MKASSRCGSAWKYRDYSRHVLRAASIAVVLFLSFSPLGAQAPSSFTEQVENRVLALVNQFRSAQSLAPLKSEQRRLRESSDTKPTAPRPLSAPRNTAMTIASSPKILPTNTIRPVLPSTGSRRSWSRVGSSLHPIARTCSSPM
jgi:hypothetical protein